MSKEQDHAEAVMKKGFNGREREKEKKREGK